MTLQAGAAENLGAAPRDEESAEVFFHSGVREVYLRKNFKNIIQTRGRGLLDCDQLRSHRVRLTRFTGAGAQQPLASAPLASGRLSSSTTKTSHSLPSGSVTHVLSWTA